METPAFTRHARGKFSTRGWTDAALLFSVKRSSGCQGREMQASSQCSTIRLSPDGAARGWWAARSEASKRTQKARSGQRGGRGARCGSFAVEIFVGRGYCGIGLIEQWLLVTIPANSIRSLPP